MFALSITGPGHLNPCSSDHPGSTRSVILSNSSAYVLTVHYKVEAIIWGRASNSISVVPSGSVPFVEQEVQVPVTDGDDVFVFSIRTESSWSIGTPVKRAKPL